MTEPIGRPSVARVGLGRRERGVTLIESLIALLVLGIALLGVASLQLLAQREEADARWRSAAVTMSGSLIEQLRTDRVAAEGLGINNGAPTGCTNPNQWLCDLVSAWLSSLSDQLPNASAQLRVQELDDDLQKAELAIVWRRVADSDADGTCRPQDVAAAEMADGGCLRVETIL